MAGIGEFVTQAAEKLGIGEDQARSGAGAILGAIKNAMGGDEFEQVKSAIPDADDAIAAAPAGDAGGDMLGGLLSKAADAIGGDAGKALDIAGMLEKAGIGTDQLGGFVKTFLDFLKAKLPKDLLDGVLGKLGGLKDLLG